MLVNEIKNGVVIDHIKSGQGLELFHILGLDKLSVPVAVFLGAQSKTLGRKDLIKIDAKVDVNLDAVGYIDPEITVNVIENGVIVRKFHPELPERIEGVISCKNPRCVTSVETLPQIFKLADREKRVYRCIYCESKSK